MTLDRQFPNIRPIEIRKDLSSIADLIERCFFETMDDEGKDYVRNVRQIARGLGGFYLEHTTPESSPLPFHGYVWIEDGKIIGNLTLIVVRRLSKHTYLIANVAVEPQHRGRGIAKALTERALQHVQENDGKKVLLQVRDDNPPAQHIYLSNGFSEDFRRTTWVWKERPAMLADPVNDLRVTSRRKEEWTQERAWLEELYPKGVSWNLPYDINRLKPGFWTWLNVFLMGGSTRSWSARVGGTLQGTAIHESGLESVDFVWLAGSPAYESLVIPKLLQTVTRYTSSFRKLQINYPATRGESAFLAAGFRKLNTLIWMSKDLQAKIEVK